MSYLCTHIMIDYNNISNMEPIIGRETEIRCLETLANSEKAEFVALYGRRRVGKTFLVNRVFGDHFAFKVTGVIEGTLRDQFLAFRDAMDEYGLPLEETPIDWMSAFILLKKALRPMVDSGKPCIIFIDELPALDAENSNVASAVGYFWNSWASQHDNITLIICGSATSWMISHVIDSKGGLHDRLTQEIPIHPFVLREVESYLAAHNFVWSREMMLQAYMILGGIPYYLSLLNRQESLVQNIDRLFFGRDMKMRREFQRLFNTLYKNPGRYVEIVKALSKSRQGLTREQLAQALHCPNNGHLGERLDDLYYCDLIRKNVVREKAIKRKDAIYQLSDFFCLFYLSFIDRAEVEPDYWSHHINTPAVNSWMGLTYERVCMAHIPQIKCALRIDGISTLCYSWRSKTTDPAAQIDIIIERADKIVNVCEVKYCQQEYELDKEEYLKLRTRQTAFIQETGLRHTAWLTLITTEGMVKGKYFDVVQSVVTLDNLFA